MPQNARVTHKIILLGKAGGGKTELAKQIIVGVHPSLFNEHTEPTIGATRSTRIYNEDNNELELWDYSGKEQLQETAYLYFKGVEVALLCFDLSESINEKEVRQSIFSFQEHNSTAHIYIIGTKADKADTDNIKILQDIQNEAISKVFITSAKTGEGIGELSGSLKQQFIAINKKKQQDKEQGTIAPEVLRLEADNFLGELVMLPEDKKVQISQEVETLIESLTQNSGNLEMQGKSINLFTQKCEVILSNNYSNATKAVLAFAAAAAVMAVAAALGFGIGLALGSWAGPGALVVAVVTASAAAGVAAGGLTAYGLFKRPKEMNSVDAFVNEISPPKP